MSRDEAFRHRLARASAILMAVALFYFVAYAAHETQRAEEAGRRRDAAIAALAKTNGGIVSKLADVFAHVIAGEEAARAAGAVPQQTVESLTASLKGYVDPALVQQALNEAVRAAKGTPGPRGLTGPAGAPGAVVTTSTVTTMATPVVPGVPHNDPPPSSTTTSTQPPAPSTTRGSTTTTKPCAVVLLGLKIACRP